MVTLNKIYTKTGDKGTTSLGDGKRIEKFSLRVKTYGTVDELNATVGLSTQFASGMVLNNLKKIQHDLFDLGADFCKPIPSDLDDTKGSDLRISSSQVFRLEEQIDEMNRSLQTLKSFILPGGSMASSYLHLCRTVCRRAERYAVKLSSQEVINQESLKYLNRLSDWFFVTARVENQNGQNDTLWVPGSNR